jgi:hypothetical protein
LKLYDFNVTYSNYTVYNNIKYVDTLAYNIKARCGVLGKNVSVVANLFDTNKTYNIVCDNQTVIINESFRFLSEGDKNVSITLLAIDQSDNKEFGFDTFRADLEPPKAIEISYTFRNGFRTDKIENVTIKPVDSISPILFCNLTANDAFYNFSTNNNTQVTRQFNLTFDNNIKVTCWDLLNHTKQRVNISSHMYTTLH